VILKLFRAIPQSLIDWDRWITEQDRQIQSAIDDLKITRGAGTPEGNVTGVIGDLYLRTDGTAGTVLYVKEAGTDAYGWAAK